MVIFFVKLKPACKFIEIFENMWF